MVTIKNKRGVEISKPKPVIEYNKNMSGIDRCDQMLSYYSSPRKTIKWYKKVMFHLLDISIWNSYYLYKKRFLQYNGHYIDYHREVVKKLIGLPLNINHGNQLVKKYTRDRAPPIQVKVIHKRRYPFHKVTFILLDNYYKFNLFV